MAKKQAKQAPSPEEVADLSTQQLARLAADISSHWLGRSEATQKLQSPSQRQLEAQPWHEYHGLVFGLMAEKLRHLAAVERLVRSGHLAEAADYVQRNVTIDNS